MTPELCKLCAVESSCLRCGTGEPRCSNPEFLSAWIIRLEAEVARLRYIKKIKEEL